MEDKILFDPVCGMSLPDRAGAVQVVYQGEVLYFCGRFCEDRFRGDPERFRGRPLIRLRNVWKVFKLAGVETRVLKGLNFHIWSGDFVVIVGASGSGKSTTLNLIGLLDKPTSGEIFLKDQNVSHLKDEARAYLRSKTFGFIFQQYNLIPWLNAYENVVLPRVFANRVIKREEFEARFRRINLTERMGHRPVELSDGEQQRIAILRALANDPEIILGDEPTGNLDSETGNKILDLLEALNKKQGKTLIIVSHDANIAKRADQVIALKDGQVVKDRH
jgi:putative ABC transport system ATP-binding protein